MPGLKETLYEKIQAWRPRIKNLLDEHGDVVVDTVTISKLIGGMRDLKCLVTDISYLDPNEGIRYRDYTLTEFFKKLPRPKGSEMPYVEGVIYLLLTGDLPTENNISEVLDEFKKRHIVPSYVYDVIDAFPAGSHPMTIFSTAILTMHRESFFARKYDARNQQADYWEPTYEDAIEPSCQTAGNWRLYLLKVV